MPLETLQLSRHTIKASCEGCLQPVCAIRRQVRGEGGFDHKRLGNAPAGGVIGQLQGELGRKAKGVLAAHRSQAHKVIRIERDLTRDGT